MAVAGAPTEVHVHRVARLRLQRHLVLHASSVPSPSRTAVRRSDPRKLDATTVAAIPSVPSTTSSGRT